MDAGITEWALRALVVAVVGALVAAVVRMIGRIRTSEVALVSVRDTAEAAAEAAASAAASAATVDARIAECERQQAAIRTRLDAYPSSAEWRQWSADLAASRAAIEGTRDMVVGLGDRVRDLDDHLRRDPR